MTATAMPAAFRTRIEDARMAREQMISRVLEILTDAPSQGVSAEEVAKAMGALSEHSVRNYLTTLIDRGLVFTRIESQTEREARFGQTMRAARAALFSVTESVPERVDREVLPGVVCSADFSVPSAPRGTLTQRIADAMSTTHFRTAAEIADRTGTNVKTIYSSMQLFEAREDVDVRVKALRGGARKYNHYRLRATSPLARVVETVSTPAPASAQPVAPKPAPPAAKHVETRIAAGSIETLDEAGDLFKTYVTSLVSEKTATLQRALDEALAANVALTARLDAIREATSR